MQKFTAGLCGFCGHLSCIKKTRTNCVILKAPTKGMILRDKLNKWPKTDSIHSVIFCQPAATPLKGKSEKNPKFKDDILSSWTVTVRMETQRELS